MAIRLMDALPRAGMKPTLKQSLHDAERQVRRVEESIVFQRRMIATLKRGGHDVKAAKMFLSELEETHEEQVARRDRLSRQIANRA